MDGAAVWVLIVLLAHVVGLMVYMASRPYGVLILCDRCGNPIEKLRLKALPYANLCLKDKQAEERVR